MKFSVVIVSWNTKDLLIDCLTSLFADEYQGKYEIWVVDNASSDGTSAAVRDLFPTVRLISEDNNVGFGTANNLAIKQCTGEYIWLLNPDTKVKPGAISALISYLEANPSAGAAGSKLLNPDGSLQTSCYPYPNLPRELWRLFHLDALRTYGVYDQSRWDHNEPREVEVIQGASLILRHEALDQIGLFDEDYFMYTEEVDLCYRLNKAGWKLYWIPQSEVIHYGGQSTQQAPTEMFISLYKTKLLFFKKHRSWIEVQSYKLALSLASLFRLLLTPLTWFEPPSKRLNHIKLAKNYQRLLLELWTG